MNVNAIPKQFMRGAIPPGRGRKDNSIPQGNSLSSILDSGVFFWEVTVGERDRARVQRNGMKRVSAEVSDQPVVDQRSFDRAHADHAGEYLKARGARVLRFEMVAASVVDSGCQWRDRKLCALSWASEASAVSWMTPMDPC